MADLTQAEIIAKLTEALSNYLRNNLDPDLFNDYISTVLPAVVTLAVTEGTNAAEDVVAGLAGNNTRPYWDRLIQVASPEERIALAETTRQAAIQDRLNLIKAKEQRWTVFKTSIGIFLSLLLSLL